MWSEYMNNKESEEVKTEGSKKINKDKIKKVGSKGKEGKKWGDKDDVNATIWHAGNENVAINKGGVEGRWET